jgi:class 3 adenylate cyclase
MFGVKCRNCGYDNLPGMKFCGQCGSQLGQVCEACGFVNPSEHRFCGQCGAALIRLGLGAEHDARLRQAALTVPPVVVPHVSGVTPIELEGERRPVTVVLADVVGSTNILERLGTEAWVRMMNRVLQALEGVVYRFGGVVDQFRGDGLVAFFGAQAAYEDDPERGVLAALGMHGAIEIYAAELIEKEGIDLHLRVGVNTGQVIVASIGDDRHHSEDTAMGEAIAVAARLEAAAKPGTVLVSENTFHLLESQFDWEPLGSITLRGISDPVPIFRPLAPQAGATRARRLQAQELSALLIGREVEFDELKAELEDLRACRGGILILTGETGMGKSSWIASLRQHAMRDDALLAKADGIEPPLGALLPGALTWLQGRCRSYAQSSPYSMWVDLLQNWLTVHEGQSQAEMRDRLRHQLETVQDDQVTEQIQDLVAFLSPFLALQLGDELLRSAEQLDAEGRREKIFLAVRNLLKLMTRQGPLVLAFEEAHWADTTSLGLLEYCLSLCDHRPLLCLIVVRPDSTSAAWEFCQRVKVELPHRLKCLTLSALSEAQASKMVDRLIGSEVLPAETSALLLERAEGNPYYIEEFIHALIQKGVLVQDEETGGWQATRAVDSLDLPSSLQNLLWARIDRLSAEQRQVLQMAAVIGPVFWSNVLQTLVGDGAASEAWRRGPAALKDHLAALQRAQLIQEHAHKPNLGTEYVFDSNLVRDAAYEGLLSVQRVTCHRQVADALEQIFGEKILARYYSLLAYHYRQASAMRKELFYTLLAAGEAREIYANVEALKHYERALYLLN